MILLHIKILHRGLSLKYPKSMGPQPREPNGISLFEWFCIPRSLV